MRERLSQDIAQEVRANLLGPGLQDDLEHYYDAMNEMNVAHLLMLDNQGLISRPHARELARFLLKMPTRIEFQKQLSSDWEEIYYNMEKYLASQIGSEIAGRLHLGRSRNDMYATASRMKIREVYFEISQTILETMLAILDLAKDESQTVMTGYTHLQPAEPITFGHYLVGVALAMERDYTRLEEGYERLNLSPLGACAFAGTSFGIDRCFTARLLGFDGVLENSIDSVASRDYIVEILADLSMIMVTVSRFVGDLYVWMTSEYSLIGIVDAVAGSSSIMPQKKNPITLEHIKSKGAHVSGGLFSALSVLRAVPFSHSREVSSESVKAFWGAADELLSAFRLLLVSITNLTINRDLMLERTRHNFTIATELANSIVRGTEMPFRDAHSLVARATAKAVGCGEQLFDIVWEMLEQELGAEFILRVGKELKKALIVSMDPARSVEAKTSLGSPNPSLVQQSIRKVLAKTNNHDKLLTQRKDRVSNAKHYLQKELGELAGCDKAF